MGHIRVLDDHTANQIAAGEVVERPSSVVKELVENAIDAGSTRIDVSIEEGGIYAIRVTDNGSGIAADDCESAFLRHATSKIQSSKDLFHIASLGFRGEALPSIAAVSRLECTTSTDQSGLGRKVAIEGGKLVSNVDSAATQGTDIWVRDLFFNTPARLKYMKTIQTELGHVSDYMYRLSLAYPNIAFTFKHNGNMLLQTLGKGDVLQVIASIYGSGTAKQMVRVQGEDADFKISGYVSKPELTRANRQAISMLVNGRYIRNAALTYAVLQAYHTLLPVHRYPLAVLAVKMDPALIDVNVHPAKLEVRFSKEQELKQFIEKAVKQSLSELIYIPQVKRKQDGQAKVIQEQLQIYRPAPAADRSDDGELHDVQKCDAEARQDGEPKSSNVGNGEVEVMPMSTVTSHVEVLPLSEVTTRDEAAPGISAPAPRSTPSTNKETSFTKRPGLEDKPSSNVLKDSELNQFIDMMKQPEAGKATLPDFPELYPIGQLHGTYIVAQNSQGLYLIDQHAAHERINYEKFHKLFGEPEQVSQELLIPITLKVTPSDAEIMKHKLDLLEQVGVRMEHFGGSDFIVRSCPYWFPKGEEQSLIEEMTEWILQDKQSINLAKLREKSAIMCACKASIKANERKSIPSLEALLDQLRVCSNPYTCPHGRPIVVSFSTYELEKMFKRVM